MGVIPKDSYCGNADRFIGILYPSDDYSKLIEQKIVNYLEKYDFTGFWSTDPKYCYKEFEGFLEIRSNKIISIGKICDVKNQNFDNYDLILNLECSNNYDDKWSSVAMIYNADHGAIVLDRDGVELFFEPCLNSSEKISTKELSKIL